MLTTVFSLLDNNDIDIEEQYNSILHNIKLIRRIDSKRHISLITRTTGGLDNLDQFDKIYEYNDNTLDNITLLAKMLPTVEADQILYLTPRIFCMNYFTRAFERNLTDGLFFPKNVLDFRGIELVPEDTWQEQQLFNKHQWPIIVPKLMFFNNDKKSKSFFEALDLISQHWNVIGSLNSDGAMAEHTWTNIIAFTCILHPELYRKTELLDFKSLAKRDFAVDKNWINKKWYDWLDVWWVTKDGFYLRIENFRQQGFIELPGNCLNKIDDWLVKSNG